MDQSNQTTTPLELAVSEYQLELAEEIGELGLDSNEYHIFLRAFKQEETLEVWIAQPNDTFSLFYEVAFCTSSGNLGPKLQEGDLQIPEGCYYIDRFNPKSKFHLSLGLNYPNDLDKINSPYKENLGKDIFIHGGCETVGCIPITDPEIGKLYVLCQNAANKHKIEVHIFPMKHFGANITALTSEQPQFEKHWNDILPSYNYFEKNRKPAD